MLTNESGREGGEGIGTVFFFFLFFVSSNEMYIMNEKG